MPKAGKAASAKQEAAGEFNIMRAWRDHASEDALVVTERAVNAIKPAAMTACWRKLSRSV